MQNKIKILYIINSFAMGGAEKMLLDLCNGLDKTKYEIAVATVMGGGVLEEEYIKTGATIFINHKKTKIGLGVIKDLKKNIKSFNPDIVHTHLWSGDTWGRLAAMGLRKKYIISTEHNRNIEESGLKKSIKHFLSYFTSIIIASSQAIKDYQVKKEMISSKKIKVIEYGINLNKFPFRGIKIARYGENHLKFTTVGRLAYQKGQRYLIEAMAKLDDEYPEITLEIAGEGPEKEDLIQVAKNAHIDRKINFLGIVKNVNELMEKTNIFVLPSVYEGLGIVLLEAMAIGVPVIASNIPAVNSIIKDEETGLLFESQNSDDLVEKIIYLLKNPDVQERMIINARKMVENHYTVQRMVDDYDKLYQRVLGNEKTFGIQYE